MRSKYTTDVDITPALVVICVVGIALAGVVILVCAYRRNKSIGALQLLEGSVSAPSGTARACLWPYPNHITQGPNHSEVTVVVPVLASHRAFRSYRSELDSGLQSPLTDFDAYVKDVSGASSLSASKGTRLTFKVTIDRKGYMLADRNSHTYASDEGHSLSVSMKGEVAIHASTYVGVGYALCSLRQLLQSDGKGGVSISHMPISIQNDAPRTYRRGVMLDTARNFCSTTGVCRVLQQMGAQKMNHFSWHISDNQSFPLNVGPISRLLSVVPSTDPLFEGMIGAFGPDQSYSLRDVRTIIGTARNYGITVEPGIDTPGHCSAFMYGSRAASELVLGKGHGFQMVTYWQTKWQGFNNAPEPVIGYLDIANPVKRASIVRVVHALFDEVYEAFQMGPGRYGRCFNINADEVSTNVISKGAYADYLNALLELFHTPKWTDVRVGMWADAALGINVKADGVAYAYNDTIHLKALDGRLTIGLWNLWPTVSVDKNNTLARALPRSDVVNFNANCMYMDAGYPGQMWSGYNYDLKPPTASTYSALATSLNQYWISAAPTVGPQWGGFRGWPVAFGKIYTYNFHWDFEGESPTSIVSDVAVGTQTAKLEGIVGASLAVWSETITEGELDGKLVTNMAALAETTWKYDETHAPDNLNHATLRLHAHLQQLSRMPFHVRSATSVYSGANIDRPFPQGCIMTIPTTEPDGTITQAYIDAHYKDWDMQIRSDYASVVNNDILANINPEGPLGANAIALCPLASRYVFGLMETGGGGNQANTGRVNPWLMQDIGTVLRGQCMRERLKPDNVARSNFASSSPHFASSPFYTDQRDAPVTLATIPVPPA